MGAALKPLLKRLAVGSPAALPTLDLDFLAQLYKVSDGAGGMSSVAFSDLITFIRSSAAWRFNASGVLEQVAANQPRFDYDPLSLQLRGLLIEEQRTNAISNSSATGAAVGTLPTGWSLSLQSGVTGSVVAVGTESGMSYVDIRFQGAISSAGLELSVLPAASVAASPGQAWACSWFVKLVGGSLAGVSETRTRVIARTSGSAYIGSDNTPFTMPVSSQLSACRRGSTYTLPANSALVQAAITAVCAAGPIDFTLRLALPQLELGVFVTSPIPTTSGQVTRASDVAAATSMSPWFNAQGGTLQLDASVTSLPAGSGAMCGASLTVGASINERVIVNQVLPSSRRAGGTGSGGVDTSLITVSGAPAINTQYRASLSYGLDDVRGAINGVSGSADTSTPLPTVTTLQLGRLGTANQYWQGHLQRFRYFPRRLFDNELRRITA